MTPTKFNPETQGKHYEVDVRRIRPLQRAGGNIRSDYGDLEELAASIEANGVIVPMRGYRVSDDKNFEWEVIDGHRRLAACQLLINRGITVRCKIITVDARKYSDEQLVLDMITTNAGKPLNPVEMAEAVRRLQNFGWKNKDISVKFGKSMRLIQNLALLAGAPKRIRDLISNGNISYTLALSIMKESVDFNDAIAKIEDSMGVAKMTKANLSPVEDAEEFAVSDDVHAKVTKKHVNIATNKVDSFKELQIVFKRQIDNPKDVANTELYSFLKRIIENKLTSSQIEKQLFNS
jgi:ParB/RepB/Spo0J family partition protein